MKLQRFSEKKSLIHEFGKFILEKQDSALTGDADAVFNIAISGGSMNQALYESLVNDKNIFPHIKWPQWRIFFCDERLVPFEDPQSNYGQFKKTVLDPLVHQGNQLNLGPTVYTINESLIGGGETANSLPLSFFFFLGERNTPWAAQGEPAQESVRLSRAGRLSTDGSLWLGLTVAARFAD